MVFNGLIMCKKKNSIHKAIHDSKHFVFPKLTNPKQAFNFIKIQTPAGTKVSSIKNIYLHWINFRFCFRSLLKPKTITNYFYNHKNISTYFFLEDAAITNKLDRFFTTTLKSLSHQLPPVDNDEVLTSTVEVLDALLTLKEDTTSGHDGISRLSQKLCFLSGFTAVRDLQKLHLHMFLPISLQSSNVSSISKSGSLHLTANYRPICILLIASKVYERFVHCDLMLKYKELNFISNSQDVSFPADSV